MSAVLASLSPSPPSSAEPEEARLAIVGRPNVGKSTLLNTLLGTGRAIVHEAPGTTRDIVDAVIHWEDKRLLLLDTAGIKRRQHKAVGVEYYSLLRALQAINQCDVALLVLDAGDSITAQDMHIATYIIEAGKGLLLLVNKWDLIPPMRRKELKHEIEQRFRFISYMPRIYISARLGQNMNRVLPQAWQVWQEMQKHLPQSEIDEAITRAVSAHPPPRLGTKQLQIIRAYQDKSRVLTFIFQVNDRRIPSSYQRYLENKLHHNFGFCGVPLRLIFTKVTRKSNKAVGVAKT